MPINNNKIRQLDRLRKKVEAIDHQLLHLLANRFSVTNLIQELKKTHGMALFQKKREKKLLAHYYARAKARKLSKAFIKDLFQLIFSYSKKTAIMKRNLNNQHGTNLKARNRR